MDFSAIESIESHADSFLRREGSDGLGRRLLQARGFCRVSPAAQSDLWSAAHSKEGVGERFLTHSRDADQITQSCFGLPSLLKGRYFLSFLCERCCFWENFDGNASGGVDFFSFSGIINGVFYFLKNRLW